MNDLILALRVLRKTPVVTAVAVISLALGVGANAAIYSLFDELLMQRLPVRAPQELVNLSAPGPKPGSQSCSAAGSCDDVFSYPMYRDLEQQQNTLVGIAAHSLTSTVASLGNDAFNANAMLVSGSYFDVLGVRPVLGRLLQPEDDTDHGDNHVTVLTYTLWQNRFAADPAIVGKTLLLRGQPFTIIGVAAKGFNGTTVGEGPDVFVPLGSYATVSSGSAEILTNRQNYWLYAFGRLKPGSSVEQAASGLNALYHGIVQEVELPLQKNMSDYTLARFRDKEIIVTAGERGQSVLPSVTRTPLKILLAITATVLLTACVNIANLLLARGAGRATEMGVRLALGATRWRLVRQLLTESLVLGLMGGLASLIVAAWTLKGLAGLLPPEAGNIFAAQLRPGVMLFAVVLAITTAVLFGIAPALHNTRSDLISSIRAGAGQITGGSRFASKLRSTLAIAQVALSVALLASAGLFMRSMLKVTHGDMGMDAGSVATFSISPGDIGYDSTRARIFENEVLEELRLLPGVSAASASSMRILSSSSMGTWVSMQGFDCLPDMDCRSDINYVAPDFIKTLGIALIEGREFRDSDREGGQKVAIVNQAFARKFSSSSSPVGKFMSQDGSSSPHDIEIVGLMQDTKYVNMKDETPPVFLRPLSQTTSANWISYYLRSTQDPRQLYPSITSLIKRVEPGLPVMGLRTLPEQAMSTAFLERALGLFTMAFAVLATLIAATGLYGVLAYSVAQRTREIGVRMALGADAAMIRNMVLKQTVRMTAIGVTIGLAIAWAVGRVAQSLLYEMSGSDPLAFAGAAIVLAAVAVIAGYAPAARAASVDPINALRAE